MNIDQANADATERGAPIDVDDGSVLGGEARRERFQAHVDRLKRLV